MMPHRNSIIIIMKSNDLFTILLRYREKMFQNIYDPLTKGGSEAIKDQMRVSVTDPIQFFPCIMSHHTIFYTQVNGGPQGEVGDNHTVRLTPVLV
jgi:hypothetical protein